MLDLQARIRLDERECRLALAAGRIDEELEGAEAVVADLLRELAPPPRSSRSRYLGGSVGLGAISTIF